MLATIELHTVTTGRCRSCGGSHAVRIATAAGKEVAEALLGFFGRCPVSKERVWFVARVPRRRDGRSLLLRMGPLDDLSWQPDELEDTLDPFDGFLSSSSPAPGCASATSRGSPHTALGGRDRAPEFLRRALGFPHFSQQQQERNTDELPRGARMPGRAVERGGLAWRE